MPERYSCGASFLDKSQKTSVFEAYVTEAAAIAFATDPTAAGAVRGILDAVEALSLAEVSREQAGVDVTPLLVSIPSDDQAYNSSKIKVYFTDNVTGDKYAHTIPARDTAAYNTQPGTKLVILTVAQGGTAEIEALITAYNTNVRSKDGNAVTVTKIEVAGGRQ